VSPPTEPLVIAHRGASGYLPEHTLAAYDLAMAQGADYIEPDLVTTRDGALIARHENLLQDTTDIADHAEFADRRRNGQVDGQPLSGWFSEDFTLDEIRRLRTRERFPALRPQVAVEDGRHGIASIDEILALVARRSNELGRRIGLYPELKHPSHFRALGLPLEPALAAALRAAGLNRADLPVIVQSFEPSCLRRLAELSPVRRAQLLAPDGGPVDASASGLRYAAMATPAGLARIAGYAQVVIVEKGRYLPEASARTQTPAQRQTPPRPSPCQGRAGFVSSARDAGLAVHAYVFRAENVFLPMDLRIGADPAQHGALAVEIQRYLALGIEGFFTDQPDLGVAARRGSLTSAPPLPPR
jgi:glycerophosphoryl diester phosphodiesterase